METMHEAYALLIVIKELAGHPGRYANILKSASDRLDEINESLAAPQPEPVEEPIEPEGEPEEIEDGA